MVLISIILSVTLLTACSSTEGTKIENIYTKASEASKNLDNFAMKVESEQLIETGKDEGSSEENPSSVPYGGPITSTIVSEMQKEPLAFHQTVKTMGQTIEQYYSEDGLYMKLSTKEGWYKAPKELVEQINSMTAQQQAPGAQLESLKRAVDEFDLEEKNSSYILSLSSEGENVKDLFEGSLKETLPNGQVPEELMKDVTFKKVSYQFTIDKESYRPQSMNIDMEFTMDQNGQPITVEQSMHGEYSRFNEVGEVTVPQEIKDQAKEIEKIESLFQS